MWLERTIEYWIAVAVAVIVKLKTSDSLGWISAATTTVVALGIAYFSAEWFSVTFSISLPIAGALTALLGEEAMRSLLKASQDPEKLKQLLDFWRLRK